ncbi:MAG: hypothetical protein R3F46_15395 [bacterium]
MSIPITGRVERLPVRDVWPHEALAFTPWLSQNLDVIGELVGLELSLESIEQTLENFRVDIIASDARGRSVVIENQFGDSDHKHLGQLLSYYASWNADVAIWIVEKARAEHVKAVSVMNEHFPADFYLIQVEAIRIGDSLPALLPTLIYGPSPETRQAAIASRELEERKADYRSFWSGAVSAGAGWPGTGRCGRPAVVPAPCGRKWQLAGCAVPEVQQRHQRALLRVSSDG